MQLLNCVEREGGGREGGREGGVEEGGLFHTSTEAVYSGHCARQPPPSLSSLYISLKQPPLKLLLPLTFGPWMNGLARFDCIICMQ